MKLFLSILAMIGFLAGPVYALAIPECEPGIEDGDTYMSLENDKWLVRLNGQEWDLKYIWVEEFAPDYAEYEHESWILTGMDQEGQTVQFLLIHVLVTDTYILYSGHLQIRPDVDKFMIEDADEMNPCYRRKE